MYLVAVDAVEKIDVGEGLRSVWEWVTVLIPCPGQSSPEGDIRVKTEEPKSRSLKRTLQAQGL